MLRITHDSVHGTRRCRHKITNSTQVGPDQLYVSGLDSRYTWLSHLDIYEFRNETSDAGHFDSVAGLRHEPLAQIRH